MPQIVDAKQKQLHSAAWRLRATLMLVALGAVAGAAVWFIQHPGREAQYCTLWLQGAAASGLHVAFLNAHLQLAQAFYQNTGNPFFVSSLERWTAGGAVLGFVLALAALTKLRAWAGLAFSGFVLGALIMHSRATGLLAAAQVAGAVALMLALRFLLSRRAPAVQSGVRDVEEDAQYLRSLAAPFEPEKYINLHKGFFLGLDGKRKPIYVDRVAVDKNHIEILGESGVGKSSLAGVLLSQFAALGESVVVFDPKADDKLPGVLARQGERLGFPVRVLDFRPQYGAQCNPFAGCRPDQVEELLQVALELGKTGDAGVDFYRGGDREATGWIAELAGRQSDIQGIIFKASADDRITEKENLWRELRQLGRVRALHATGSAGLDLAAVLNAPGVLYVIGSTTRLEVVAAQKLLLQRVLQVLEERADRSSPVALFLDELKYLLSPAALRAAGTVRDRNAHLIFAHQSLGDLDDCPGLSPKAVKGAIWGNAGIKIAYRVMDSATAQELAAMAGQARADVQTQSTSTDETGGERSSTSSTHAARDYMPAHVFTHLPKPLSGEASVGVLFGLGTAFYCSTRWLPAGAPPAAAVLDDFEAHAPAPAAAAAAAAAAQPAPASLAPADAADMDDDSGALPPGLAAAAAAAAAPSDDDMDDI